MPMGHFNASSSSLWPCETSFCTEREQGEKTWKRKWRYLPSCNSLLYYCLQVLAKSLLSFFVSLCAIHFDSPIFQFWLNTKAKSLAARRHKECSFCMGQSFHAVTTLEKKSQYFFFFYGMSAPHFVTSFVGAIYGNFAPSDLFSIDFYICRPERICFYYFTLIQLIAPLR